MGELYQTFTKNTNPFQTPQKKKLRRGNTPKFTRPAYFGHQIQNQHCKKRKFTDQQPLVNTNAKVLNKNTSKQFNSTFKRLYITIKGIYSDSAMVQHIGNQYTLRMKDNNHMIILIHTEKHLTKLNILSS